MEENLLKMGEIEMSNIKKIVILKNTNGDTRVADHVPTFSEFETSNKLHVADVGSAMSFIARLIAAAGKKHDWSKLIEPYRSMFYRDMCQTIEGTLNFTDGEWSKFHYHNERHHLNRNVQEDVNLIDVIEMICDCVCAGMARSGEVREILIDDEVLQLAVKNTVSLLLNQIELAES